MTNMKLTLITLAISAATVPSAYADSSSENTAIISTQLTTDTSYEDIADAAVWVSPNKAKEDLLIATLEGDGLAVFDQKGRTLMRDDSQEFLGADVRYGLLDGNASMDVLVVGLPDDDAFGFYRINPKASPVLQPMGTIKTDIAPEAVCLYKNVTTGETTVTGLSDEGEIVQYKIQYKDGQIKSAVIDSDGDPVAVRRTHVGGELSACVVDDETGTLYVAEQDIGIWVYGADAENVKDRRLLDAVKPLGHLEEIEGMDLAYQANGKGYLVVADEGAGFLVYDRDEDNSFRAKFNAKGFEEAKNVTVSANSIWLGNTEADEPVYEKVELEELSQKLKDDKVDFMGLLSHRDLIIEGVKLVAASGETIEVDDDGDAADDSAFWINPKDATKSLIIATNKQGGLMAYNLQGEELQYLEGGEPNNVDIRTVKDWDGSSFALATASNRDFNTLALYKISDGETPIQPLKAIGNAVHENAAELVSNVDEVYGLCMYQTHDGTTYSFMNGKNGVIEQWRLTPTKKGVEGKMVRTLKVETQPEGCVADDETGTLYVGEEDKAIWAFQADENGSTKARLFAAVDGKQLVDDIEGITLYQNGQVNYLIASSQGNNTYSVFDLNNNDEYVASFAIIGDDTKGVDGSSDTDGIHAVSVNLGAEYPQGIFIAQDWNNLDAEYGQLNQNFKIVDWRNISAILRK